MSGIIQSVLNFLTNFANSVSLPIFMIVGAIVEEVIAIIPSPFVPLTAGTLALSSNKSLYYVLFLALVGATAKIFTSSSIFWLADKFEDLITRGKIGKFLGLDSNEIERYGKIFSKSKNNTLIIFILRALPFVPTVPITVVAGLIKIKYRVFIVGTFLGMLVRNTFYLMAAFYGLKQFQGLLDSMDTLNLVLEVVIVVAFVGFAFYFLRNNWDRIFKNKNEEIKDTKETKKTKKAKEIKD